MPLVTRASIGEPAFARLVREGVVLPYGPSVGRPADIPDSPGMRALGAALTIPCSDVLTGWGALWVRGWTAAAPASWHTVTPRRARDKHRRGVARHGGVTRDHAEAFGALQVARPARACVDALQWDPLDVAVALVARGVLEGRVTADELRAAAHLDRRPGPQRTRAHAALATVLAATDAATPRDREPGATEVACLR